MAFIYQYERERLAQIIKGMASRHSIGGRVLDVGAGRTLRYKKYFTEAKEYLTQDIVATDSQSHDFVCDAKNIPAQPMSFDAIVSTQVLEHVPEPWLVIKEMDRLLKPGGVCLLTVPQANELHEEPHDYFRYTKYGLVSLGKSVGWEVSEMHALGDYWTSRIRESQRMVIEVFKVYDSRLLAGILSRYYQVRYFLASLMDRFFIRKELKHKFSFGWVVLFRKPI